MSRFDVVAIGKLVRRYRVTFLVRINLLAPGDFAVLRQLLPRYVATRLYQAVVELLGQPAPAVPQAT